MIPAGTIFRLGANFRPIYLRGALMKVVEDNYRPHQTHCEILELPKNGNRRGRFYVGGSAVVPHNLIPSEVWNAVAA